MKKVLFVFFLVPLMFVGCSKKGVETAGKEGQTFLKVTVAEDNVDLRYHPRVESSCSEKKLNKGDEIFVAGLDQKESAVDGKKGFWVHAYLDAESAGTAGYWIFSSKIDGGKNLSPNALSFDSESIKENGKITIAIKDKGGKVSKHDVHAEATGDFYSFSWNPWESGFNYADPVGTFIFYPADKSIVRFSSIGSEQSGMWTKPSPDLKYVLSDGGTSTGIRGIVVYDALTDEKLFAGSYYYGGMDYSGADYSNGKIRCVKPNAYLLSDEKVSDFVANTPMPEDIKNSPLTKVVLELYEHDLVTGEEKSSGYMYAVEE